MNKMSLQKSRWLIAAAAVVMQLCLGTVYAWSVFKKPLMVAHGWTETSTQAAFMICIGMIGICAALGGAWLDKKGPRLVATTGGILFGLGTLLAAYADYSGNIFLLYLGYGFIAGGGNGLAYVTPIATLIRWFPDKRGLVTGLAVMGFGIGAFFMAQTAPHMINELSVAKTWFFFGVVFLVLTTGMARFFKNPPAGWLPHGFTPNVNKTTATDGSWTFPQAFKTRQWWMLWTIFFMNISAGIGLLSQLSPLAQEIQKAMISDHARLAVAGGVVLSIASLFNGLGRLFWAWLSDAAGRKAVFIIMFAGEIALFLFLPQVKSIAVFTLIACYLLSCYGGGFSVMPAFVADSFGPVHVGRIYGAILTAWSAAGVVGPLVFARMKDSAIYVAAAMLVVGLLLVIIYRKPDARA